jgi:long-chain acyl-CoA synthetase
MEVAKRYGPARMDGQSIGLWGQLLYGLGNLLVYGPFAQQPGLFACAGGLYRR